MKKILIIVSSLVLSSSVFAATPLTAGGSAGAVTKVGKDTSGGAAVACDALSTDTIAAAAQVKVGLSKENLGAIACSATEIAVGVASPKGKGKSYSSNSGGGALKEDDCSGTPQVCDQGQVESKVDASLTAAAS